MFETRPLSETFGAEVIGASISANSSPEEIAAVKALWAEHKLLLFRGQSVD